MSLLDEVVQSMGTTLDTITIVDVLQGVVIEDGRLVNPKEVL